MKKHATSHGLAVLVCTVASGVLVKMGLEYKNDIIIQLNNFSRKIIDLLDIDFAPDAISTVLIAIILAAIWGVAFSFMHSDK